ncbi:hypothetical protein LCGC14_1321810 [marine sediment metagenome]|uniref:Uncharacterized protein n=1 Tax=marine sediment metagenome TaxID=412755 RepID=A0A0F9N004_9ZZZZ
MIDKPPTIKKKTSFQIVDWTNENQGQGILLYGVSGIGKTTLWSLIKNAACIATDTGGRLMGTLKYVPGVTDFATVRLALQSNIWKPGMTAVVDQVTELERWAIPHMFKTVPKNQSGSTVKNIEDYGYHKGYRRWYDLMGLVLGDCSELIRRGVNVVLVAQSTICKSVQAGTDDFVKEGPALHHDKNVSTMNAYIEWADHVLRLANCSVTVSKDGKAAGESQSRAVYVHPQPHFHAKSRTISSDYDVVAFEDVNDDSIWRLIFGE